MRGFIVGLIITLLALFAWTPDSRARDLEIHTLGLPTHGDSILVITPSRKTILVDAGMEAAAPSIIASLKKQRVKRIDLLVLTHDHPDHVGGMPEVAKAFEVGEFWESDYPATSAAHRRLLARLKSAGTPRKAVSRGIKKNIEKRVMLEVLGPEKPWISGAKSDANANSVVMRLVYRKTRFLLTGDMEKETEARFLADGVDFSCDVLKVAHHGSRTSSTAAFIRATGARLALISCEPKSSLGHPRPQVLNRLRANHMDWYRTDRNGTIVVKTSGGGPSDLRVSSQREKNDTTVNNVDPLRAARNFLDASRGAREPPPPPPSTKSGGPKRETSASPGGNPASGKPSAVPAPPGERLIGKIGKETYHRPDCPVTRFIRKNKRVHYATWREAEKDGRRACKVCNPKSGK